MAHRIVKRIKGYRHSLGTDGQAQQPMHGLTLGSAS